ncbi:hypothetical protein I79_008949 [Cricetulus griseus]|uniref:Uncharacterized protein n=1 Tax=Cricetulus griseus TaxID=10029 RepID=G3HEG5_CRIGR|nr:hypothetical protein I79_008949 [Cricetulus griseus]
MSPSLVFPFGQGVGYNFSEKHQGLRILLFEKSLCSHESRESSSYHTLQMNPHSQDT